MTKYIALLLLLFPLFIGCSKNVGIKGRVVFADDKTPVEQGIVCFEKDGYLARGSIDKNGYYVVGAETDGSGLERGEYKIYFQNTEKTTYKGAGASLPTIEQTIDAKYTNASTSGLTLDVKNSQTFNIELDRYNPESGKKK